MFISAGIEENFAFGIPESSESSICICKYKGMEVAYMWCWRSDIAAGTFEGRLTGIDVEDRRRDVEWFTIVCK